MIRRSLLDAFREAGQKVFVSSQHAYVQHAANEDASGLWQVKDDVLAVSQLVKSRVDIKTGTTDTRHLLDLIKVLVQFGKISICLSFSPSIYGVVENLQEVASGVVGVPDHALFRSFSAARL